MSRNLPAGVDAVRGGGNSLEEFDFHPPVIVLKHGGPLFISSHSQRELVAKLKVRSLIYIWGGAAAALWGLWEIVSFAESAGLFQGNS